LDLEKFWARLERSNDQVEELVQNEILRVFAEADVDANSSLDEKEVEQLHVALQARGFELLPFRIQSFDFDRNGHIEPNEFAAVVHIAIQERAENLRRFVMQSEEITMLGEEAWAAAGLSRWGHISLSEGCDLLKVFAEAMSGEVLDSEQVLARCKRYDKNRNDVLERSEFHRLFVDYLMAQYYLPRHAKKEKKAKQGKKKILLQQ